MTAAAVLPANTAFSTRVPALQLAWDSVSLGAAKRCWREYELRIVRGWQPRRPNVHLQFGIWAHSARERYYHARATGKAHDDALDVALAYLLETTWDRALCRPWASDDANKNRVTLVRSMVWYLDHWRDDPLQTIALADGKPAVELSFVFETTYRTSDSIEVAWGDACTRASEAFLLCGHLDRLATMNSQVYLSDLKTTKNALDAWYFAQFSPHDQFSLYSYAVPIVYSIPSHGLIVDAMQVLVNGTRFQRAPVSRTQSQLDEWYRGLGDIFARAEHYAREGFWPMNEHACWRCDFRAICARPPGAREQWLAADFTQRVWDPLVARGDV